MRFFETGFDFRIFTNIKTSVMAILKRFIVPTALMGIVLLSVTGCSEKNEDPVVDNPAIPSVTTDIVTAILQNSASGGGTVTSDGGSPVTLRGVCWSKSPEPTIADAKTDDSAGSGHFTSQVTDLDTNTLYYVRAFATNSQGTAYGNTRSFTTLKAVTYAPIVDIDGNKYPVFRVGLKLWLMKNLMVTHYRNGDPIPKVTPDTQWKTLTTGAYCIYDNQAPNETVYGNLYNWQALNDSRGLCPGGWHVPSGAEWAALGDSLGGVNVAGGKMKSPGTIEGGTGLWFAPNTGATNSSGFAGIPGGYRINYGTYYSLGNVGYFWSSTDTASVSAWNYILDANNGELKRNFNLKTNGFSVRCCKD